MHFDMPRVARRVLLLIALAFMIACIFLPVRRVLGWQAQDGGNAGPIPVLATSADPMKWWREARFGMFIHWGPVSLKGTEIGWSRGGERRGQGGTGNVPFAVYDNLYKEFNPVKFDAEEWVRIAQAAGMKYIVFTSKHHDGFCEFDSALTDYKITNAPFKRDIVNELANACHKAGMKLGFYYSQPDWHNADYRTANHSRYIEYLHGQLRELCTKYGKIEIIWFDGLGGKAADWDAGRLQTMIRELQPGILINNRCGLPADFDTPEQHVGAFQNTRPWESCITIGQQWAWKPEDNLKSPEECISLLVRSAGGDGNLLLNVGPMPTGEIEQRQIDRLREIGNWMRKYGESIYNTRGGPFKPDKRTASTWRDNHIYVHLLDGGRSELHLPQIPAKVVSSRVLTGGKAEFKQSSNGITVRVESGTSPAPDTIVVLTLDKTAGDLPVRLIPSGSLATGKEATASSVNKNQPQSTAGKTIDDEFATHWMPDALDKQPWLEINLGQPKLFNWVEIDEVVLGSNILKFELQYERSGNWKTIFAGTSIGRDFVKKFQAVRAQKVRLHLQEISRIPSIAELQLFMR